MVQEYLQQHLIERLFRFNSSKSRSNHERDQEDQHQQDTAENQDVKHNFRALRAGQT